MIIDLTNNNMSLEEALFVAKPNDVIKLANKTYFEKIRITTPNLTLIGDADTVIEYDAYNSRIVPIEMGGDGVKKFGTTGSSTIIVSEEAMGFKAYNITFKNSFVKKEGINGGQAVAFKSETSNVYIENCKFISFQDTLYMDVGFNNTIKNCYIEGDVDFIFGSADCLFENCNIVAKNVTGIAYYTAPSTLIINDYGFVFHNCSFNTIDNVKAYLGRPWFPGGASQPIYPRVSFIDCSFDGDVELEMLRMHQKDPSYYDLKINNCSFNGEKFNRNDDVTNQLNILK